MLEFATFILPSKHKLMEGNLQSFYLFISFVSFDLRSPLVKYNILFAFYSAITLLILRANGRGLFPVSYMFGIIYTASNCNNVLSRNITEI